MKKNIIAISLFVITIIIGVGALVVLKNESPKYTLNYTDNNNLFTIKVFENRITVNTKETVSCIKAPCDTIDKNYKIAFSEDNMDKIYDTMKIMFTNDEKVKDIKANAVSNQQKKVLDAIIANDEDTLEEPKPEETTKNDIEDDANRELLFTLKSNRINCLTVNLKVYADKSYELETKSNEKDPVSGKYTYDVNKIIENASKYEKNDRGVYTLTTQKGETITLYDTNKELTDFLRELNVNLDVCMDMSSN